MLIKGNCEYAGATPLDSSPIYAITFSSNNYYKLERI